MDFWQGFITLTFIHLLAAASPGPDFAYVSRQSLVVGRSAGLLASVGISLGLSVHIIYSAAGLAAIVAHSAEWITVLKIIGGCYLIYLGMKCLRSGPHGPDQFYANSQPALESPVKQIFLGFLCNAFNPKAPIYFLALFTTVLSPQMPLLTLAIYGAWIMLLQLFWFSLVTVIFTHGSIRKRFLLIGHWIDRLFGTALTVLGIYILVSDTITE